MKSQPNRDTGHITKCYIPRYTLSRNAYDGITTKMGSECPFDFVASNGATEVRGLLISLSSSLKWQKIREESAMLLTSQAG
jgi:hypothetical protein